MSTIIDTFATLGTGLVPALAAIGGAIGGSKFVQEGERGLKVRFGKVRRDRDGNPKVVYPGFCFVIPTIERLVRTHVRTRTFNLPTQEVVLADRMVFQVSGVVRVQVRDDAHAVYSVLYETSNIGSVVADYVTTELREVLAKSTYEQVVTGESVVKQVTGAIKAQLNQWGLVLTQFNLSDCSPTEQTARVILLGAETGMRADALLLAAAKVAGDRNVAALSPTVAAALIGTPVATSLTGSFYEPAGDS